MSLFFIYARFEPVPRRKDKQILVIYLATFFAQKLRHHFFLYVFSSKTFSNPVIKRKSAATINQYNNICGNKIRMRLFLTNFEYVTKLLDCGQLTFFGGSRLNRFD